MAQFLRQDTRFTDDAHEIRIANPPRHHVQMEVLADAGAGGLPQIHPNIETFRPVEFLKGANASLGELHHFGELFRFCNSDCI